MKKTDNVVLQSLNNCWLALCQRMRENPTAETQYVMNLLGRIITKAECEAERKAKTQPKQISIEEWLAWLKNDNDEV